MLTDGLALVWAAVIGGLFYKRPAVGLWLICLSIPAYAARIFLGPLPTNFFEIGIAAALLGYLAGQPILRSQRILASLKPLAGPLVLVGIGLIVGTVVSADLRASLGILKGWFVVPLILYGLIVTLVTPATIRQLVWALLLSTLPLAAVALGQALIQDFVTVDGRASAWFTSANYLSMYLVPISLLGSSLIVSEKSPLKWGAYAALALNLAAVYFSYSYSGWFGAAAGLITLAVYGLKMAWPKLIGSLAAITILAVLSQLPNPRFIQMLDLSRRSSASVRLQVWATDLLMIKERWLAGIGLGQYETRYLSFADRIFHPPIETSMLHGHNLFLHTWINLGLVGLVGFGWLIVRFFQLLKAAVLPEKAFLVSAFAAILAHGLLDTTYWKNDLAAVFWVILGLVVVGYNSSKSHHAKP